MPKIIFKINYDLVPLLRGGTSNGHSASIRLILAHFLRKYPHQYYNNAPYYRVQRPGNSQAVTGKYGLYRAFDHKQKRYQHSKGADKRIPYVRRLNKYT